MGFEPPPGSTPDVQQINPSSLKVAIYVLVYAGHKVKKNTKNICVLLVYCVGFYILYNLCSIFKKRRFLEFRDHGWEKEGGMGRGLCGCAGFKSWRVCITTSCWRVSECNEALDLHIWISI